MFSNIDDQTGTMDSIVNYIITEQGGFGEIGSWSQFKNKVDEHCKKGKVKDQEITVMSWRKFKRIINKALSHPIFQRLAVKDRNETRLRDAIKNIQKNDAYVIDIAKLDQDTQAFVFGR